MNEKSLVNVNEGGTVGRVVPGGPLEIRLIPSDREVENLKESNLEVKVGATIPQNGSKGHEIEEIGVSVKRSYHYGENLEKTILLSKRERFVIEKFLEFKNYYLVASLVRGEFKVRTTDMVVRRWLEKPYMQEYMAREWRKRAVAERTKEDWMLEGWDFKHGLKKANGCTALIHKIEGMAMGWIEPQVVSQSNIQVNLLQRDGSE